MSAFPPPPNMSPEKAFWLVIRGATAFRGSALFTHKPNCPPDRVTGFGSGTFHVIEDDPVTDLENHGPAAFQRDQLRGAVCCEASGPPIFAARDKMGRALMTGEKIAVILTRPETHAARRDALLGIDAEIDFHILDPDLDISILPGPVADIANLHERAGRA